MTDSVVGRFAPTPSGRMHLGNLFCALLAWLSARAQGGRVVLRVEDLDPDRSSMPYAAQLEEDLRFLGLDWDEGGSDGGPHAPYYQGQRGAYYARMLDQLQQMDMVYPCFCSRAQLHAADAPHASDGEVIYSGRCRGLDARQVARRMLQRRPALRLRVPDETISFTDGHYGQVCQYLPSDCGDFILRRSDGVFAYQLAVVADDAAMGVTEVVRGRDLLSSTPRQLLLYRLLGFSAPRFCHAPLLLAADGRRLSKRDADMDLDALRTRGLCGADIVGRLAYAAGLQQRPVPVTPQALVAGFSWAKVPHADIRLPRGLF
nr:tRNA glutamyl-Q(34) synthetase GluQRS [Maliibacterium massiliense]